MSGNVILCVTISLGLPVPGGARRFTATFSATDVAGFLPPTHYYYYYYYYYYITGGQGIAVAPIIGKDGYSDIFFVNEGNPAVGNPGLNSLFRNRGDGTFEDVADESGSKSKHSLFR